MNHTDKIFEDIKNELIEEKTKIVLSLKSLKEQDPYSDPDRLSDNAASDTEAKEESSHERMEALEKELNRKLLELDDALARLTDGTYGVCGHCKKNIDSERLKINPTAKTCVSCQSKTQ